MLDLNNSIRFCKVVKVLNSSDESMLVYDVMDVSDGRFLFVEHSRCADTERVIKNLKKRLRDESNPKKKSTRLKKKR